MRNETKTNGKMSENENCVVASGMMYLNLINKFKGKKKKKRIVIRNANGNQACRSCQLRKYKYIMILQGIIKRFSFASSYRSNTKSVLKNTIFWTRLAFIIVVLVNIYFSFVFQHSTDILLRQIIITSSSRI